MQLLHRQLEKLLHVVFTLCDGLSNSFSRLRDSRLIIQHCYELPINLKLRPAIRHYEASRLRLHSVILSLFYSTVYHTLASGVYLS